MEKYFSDMKIGYDAKRIVSNSTGLGRYGRTIINAISAEDSKDEFLLYAPDEGRNDLRCQVETRPNVSFHYPNNRFLRLQRDIWRSKGIVRDLIADKVSLYHGLSGELPLGIKSAGIPAIVTIHDLIFLRHPEFYNWIDVQIYKHKFCSTMREASCVIAVSECTKRDILYYYSDFPEDKIKVIYTPISPIFTGIKNYPQSALLTGVIKYYLQVGTIEERKNALESVMALDYLPEEMHCVLVGRETRYAERLRSYAHKHKLDKRLHILNDVNDEELVKIYMHADCFVYPSRYEGFGLPIIEAIRYGLPIIAATGSCLEEAGGSEGIYVSPDKPESLAKAIMEMASSTNRGERVSRMQSYVERSFDSKKFVSQIMELYDRFRP